MTEGAALVVVVADLAVKAVEDLRRRLGDRAEAHQTDLLALQLVTHPQEVGRGALHPAAVLDPLDGLKSVAHVHDDEGHNHLGHSLVVAARGAQHGDARIRAGGGVKVCGGGAAVTDRLEPLVARQHLFGHAVELGDEHVGLHLQQVFEHFILVIALTGFGPRLVQDLVEHLSELSQTIFGIGSAYIDFHGNFSFSILLFSF